jgi:glucose/arabinose dehydrogenase
VRTIALTALAGIVAANATAQLRTRVYATGFNSPVAVVQDPTDRNVQFVVQQNGHIRVVRGGNVLASDFLDLSASVVSGGEQGLLGLAFAPDYATSGRFFVNFTNPQGNTVVARFRRSADPAIADRTTRFDLRWNEPSGAAFIFQPYPNHNGGNLVFGPDGYLYVGLGDGGAGDDPQHRAQNPSVLLGKMLRVDVNVADTDTVGYRVPPDNPFVKNGPAGTRPEIWAFGLRNPWRYSFDEPARGGTGALVIGDVGQSNREEVDYEPRARGGRNYGWRNFEGTRTNVTTLPLAFEPPTAPIYDYDRTLGVSVTGGYVYRGTALGAAYQGRYFFADYSGRVWSIALTIDSSGEARASNLMEHTAELGGASQLGTISTFGINTDGELFIASHSLGRILVVSGPLAPPAAPIGLRIIRP